MQQQTPPNMLQPMPAAEEMTPKRQAVVDRLRRRLDAYRRRQVDALPRSDQSFSAAVEQQNLETVTLQKRFLEGKAKRAPKKVPDRKPDLPLHTINNLHSSVHVQQKFGCGDYEPPSKLQCGGGRGEGLTKFSVEIVQQLEFTTSAADSHPQQISTNVTVKALTNAAVKSDSSPPPPPQSPLDCKRECKSEAPDDDFVGLDECAAALERDAFPGLADLIGEEDGDDITSAAIEDLITEISEYPEFMKNFDLDGGPRGVDHGQQDTRSGYTQPALSPAAHTLKQMAEQHQAAAAAEWRYRPYAACRPRAPDLHMSQQMHVSQPHHNIQVSSGQHMTAQTARHTATAQQGMYFAHSPQGGAASPHRDSYTVSQSQSLSFRPGPDPHHNTPLGLVSAGMTHELQAKMMQQQQQRLLRQQQLRPPPPEYKPPGGAPPPRFAGARRMPYGQPRPPPSQYAAGGDWRHMHAGMRHPFSHHHQGGFGNVGGVGSGGGGTGGLTMHQQQQQMQHQLHQHQLMQQHQQQRQNQQQGSMSHLMMQQNQSLSAHGQMSNVHMAQSQSMSAQSGFPAPDFSLDFLDNANEHSLTAQELLSSLDNTIFNDIM